MYDTLIIGGGVIGLSIAWRLAETGQRVAVVDRGPMGREASWAGAGILPPANRRAASHPLDELRGLSLELHGVWAQELRELTGIDTGYRVCGGLYLASTLGEAAALRGLMATSVEEGVKAERLTLDELGQLEPALKPAAASGRIRSCYLLPEEAQLRNPWHMKALAAACTAAGVTLLPEQEVVELHVEGDRLTAARTPEQTLRAASFCVCTGSWTQKLLSRLNLFTAILPIRGQMVLLRCEQPPFTRVLNEGNRYLVPRADGRVLVGSTEEEVGFCKETTEEALGELTRLARSLVPALEQAPIERSWAGLRPATFDGFPYLGRLPGLENGYIAAGHFRSGIYLSPGTATVMVELMTGRETSIELAPFSVLREGVGRKGVRGERVPGSGGEASGIRV